MTNHVKGKVIIITGAAGGFGRLVAQKCAALGKIGNTSCVLRATSDNSQ